MYTCNLFFYISSFFLDLRLFYFTSNTYLHIEIFCRHRIWYCLCTYIKAQDRNVLKVEMCTHIYAIWLVSSRSNKSRVPHHDIIIIPFYDNVTFAKTLHIKFYKYLSIRIHAHTLSHDDDNKTAFAHRLGMSRASNATQIIHFLSFLHEMHLSQMHDPNAISNADYFAQRAASPAIHPVNLFSPRAEE